MASSSRKMNTPERFGGARQLVGSRVEGDHPLIPSDTDPFDSSKAKALSRTFPWNPDFAINTNGLWPDSAIYADYTMCKTLREVAEVAWYFQFNNMPYSNFDMIDVLRKRAGLSYEDIWKDPKILSRKAKLPDETIRKVAENMSSKHGMDSIGRCTLFALEVAYAIEMKCPTSVEGSFDFNFFDMSRHRLAHCSKTGLLIDSSSMTGPIFLSEREWQTYPDQPSQPKYYYEPGAISRTQRFGNDGTTKLKQESVKPISRSESTYQCLHETARAKDLQPVCYFRSYAVPLSDTIPSTTEYHGMIKWLLKDKQVRFIEKLEGSPETWKITTFSWESKETQAAHDDLRKATSAFVESHGGPHGREQWIRSCQMYHEMLMDAANSLWGYAHQKGAPRTLRSSQLEEAPGPWHPWDFAENLGPFVENEDPDAGQELMVMNTAQGPH